MSKTDDETSRMAKEIMERTHKEQEYIAAAFMQETGLKASEIQLVHQTTSTGMRFWVEKKKPINASADDSISTTFREDDEEYDFLMDKGPFFEEDKLGEIQEELDAIVEDDELSEEMPDEEAEHLQKTLEETDRIKTDDTYLEFLYILYSGKIHSESCLEAPGKILTNAKKAYVADPVFARIVQLFRELQD